MFSLHERTQRRACRIAFVLACALPTISIIGWAVYFNRPWQERDWRQGLESTLHVRATVGKVAAPRPWEREIAYLELASLDSPRSLAEIRNLSIKPASSFAVEHAEIDWSQLAKLAEAIQIWLSGESFQPIRLHVNSVKLIGGENLSCELNNLCAESGVSANNMRRVVMTGGLEGGRKVQLLIERTIDGKTHVAFDAQQAVLPAWLLADVAPGAARWSHANFEGVLRVDYSASQVTGRYSGSITPIDTQGWIGTDELQTQANLHFDLLSWRNRRIQAIEGQLETSEGQIHNALLKAFKERLYCPLGPQTNDKVDYQPFQRAACRFRLAEEGLTVTGTCTPDGCLMIADGKPLVMQPAYSNLPLAHLVQVLCPSEKSWLPANREATSMAERLPLPERASNPGAQGQTTSVNR